MYHYTYKTTSTSGKYYVGRHSTKNLNDNYLGSGKWIRSLKDKSSLQKEILEFYDSFEELKKAEYELISENIENPDCMNFNNSSVGFATGDLNPAKTQEEREKRSIRSKGENNPSKRPEVKSKISLSQLGKPSPHKGKSRSIDVRNNISEGRTGITISLEGRLSLSLSRKKQYENGERIVPTFKDKKHSDQTKEIIKSSALNRKSIECPHCGKKCKPHTYKRWHGDNCKEYIILKDKMRISI